MSQTVIFTKVYNTFIESGLLAEIHPNHLKLLIALCKYMDENGVAFPSQDKLAKNCGFTDQAHVRKWLTSKKNGLLHTRFACLGDLPIVELSETRKNPKGQEFNVYRILSVCCMAKFDYKQGDTGTNAPPYTGTNVPLYRGTYIPPNKNHLNKSHLNKSHLNKSQKNNGYINTQDQRPLERSDKKNGEEKELARRMANAEAEADDIDAVVARFARRTS